MANTRNILFSIIICIFLFGPIILLVAQEGLRFDFPNWISAEDATYLSGGIEEDHVAKYLNPKGFINEKLQSNLEIAINNHIPLKASVLLGNAAVQRGAIIASNTAFSFPAFPTYYGSDKLASPDFNALARMPDGNQMKISKGTKKTAKGLLKISKAYPDINFCIIVADESNTSEANPAFGLVSNHATTSDCVNILREELDGAPNICIVSHPYKDTKLYYQNYYTTDHHWNGYGSIVVYDEVKKAMGFKNARNNNAENIVFPELVTNGSFSREGLMFLNEKPIEPQFDLTGLKVENNDEPPLISKNSIADLLALGQKATFMFYSSWYGTYQLAAQSPIVNTNASEKNTAVVIQDSFNNSLHWLLAQNHSRMECFSDTKPSKKKHTLQERIEATGAKTIYLVGNVSAIMRLTDEQPNYFELDSHNGE